MERIKRDISKVFPLIIALLMVVAGSAFSQDEQGLPAGQAPTVEALTLTGRVILNKCDFVSSDTFGFSTTSTTFVDVPYMSVSFSIPGTAKSNMLVSYTAQVFARDDLMMVRALLDGVTVATPYSVQLAGDDDEDGDYSWARSHAIDFVFMGVSPGYHTVKIQWLSYAGHTIYTHQRTMAVYHK